MLDLRHIRLRDACLRGAGVLLVCASLLLAEESRAQVISEFVAEHNGADTKEFVEIFGRPQTSYSGLRVVVLEGDAGENPGEVDRVFQPGITDIAGFWHTGFLTADSLEPGTLSLLLVEGDVAVGIDLDLDDDGALDSAPWTNVLDSISVTDLDAGDRSYGTPVLTPDFDGGVAEPGGASRFPYGLDTDGTTDWKRDDPDNAAFPSGAIVPGTAFVTPGMVNLVGLTDYYAGVDASSSGTLRATVHAAIRDHIRYPYSSTETDTWDILEAADQNPSNSANILDVYKNLSLPKHGGGGSNPNREHTWPQSYGFPDEAVDNSPRTDCHHLFLSDSAYNSDRGNRPFDNCSSGCTERTTVANNGAGGGSGVYPGNSNWFSGNKWETWKDRKGDVARAILYMDVRYELGAHSFTGYAEPDLIATCNTSLITTTGGVNAPVAYMGILTTLVGWDANDPPDAKERARNDAVYRFQGNRNPFVDHPEWVGIIFSNPCVNTPTPTVTPTVTGTPPTATSTRTATPTATVTATRTASGTPTNTQTPGGPTSTPSPTPTVTPTSSQPGGASELFISEYVEGSGSNRGIEIFNGTDGSIDLGAGQYLVQIYANGGTSPTSSIALSGTIVPGDVFVLAHTDADFIEDASQASGGLTFNGDDAIVLRKNGTGGVPVDVIGQVGVDPGSAWTGGGLSTLDQTLIRKPAITHGDTSSGDAFNPSVEWTGLGLDDFGNLGTHLFQPPGTATPTATATVTATQTVTSTSSATQTSTMTPTWTATPASTSTGTPTSTPTFTAPPGATQTTTATPSPSPSATQTAPGATATSTPTETPPVTGDLTSTPAITRTSTPSPTTPPEGTATPTQTPSAPARVSGPGSGLSWLLVGVALMSLARRRRARP